VCGGHFSPRSYVVEHLTLEKGARHYLDIVAAICGSSGERAAR